MNSFVVPALVADNVVLERDPCQQKEVVGGLIGWEQATPSKQQGLWFVPARLAPLACTMSLGSEGFCSLVHSCRPA